MVSNIVRLVWLTAILIAVSACSTPAPSAPPQPTTATMLATSTPAPTVATVTTAAPTSTAIPVATMVATMIPTAPTATAIPTANTPAPTPTPFASEIGFASGDAQLKGFIWKPEGQGPFPALLWNHGSEKLPGNLPDNAAAFVGKGYVFFIPHRRGQGRSPGNYISDQIAAAKTADERSKLLVKLHETEQLQDQLAALTYLKSLNYVDKNRIAVAGCSFGGIQTVLGAEAKSAGYRAAVDFTGGAQSWATSPDLKTRMNTAVLNSPIPILFIQAENDYDLAPSKELSEAMQKAGKPFKLKFFPPFPAPGADKQEGHEFCVRGVNLWGAEVFAFLSENMK